MYSEVIAVCPPIVLFPLPLVIALVARTFGEGQLVNRRRGVTTPDLQSRCKKVIFTNRWQRRS